MLGVFLDSETNGLNPRIHQILEIALKIVDLGSGQLHESYETLIAQPAEGWEKSDSESLKINGLHWKDVARGKRGEQVAQEIIHLFAQKGIQRKKAVFICQNPSFDRAFFSQLIDADMQERLNWPYHWLDLASMYWAIAIKQAKTEGSPLPWDAGVSKDTIAARYKLPPESQPHRAMNGVNHLLLCYQAVVGYPGK